MSHAELRSLVDFLRQHVEAMARDLEGQIRADADLRRRALAQREAEDATDDFESEWIPRLARRTAVAIALRCLFLRVLEDRGLLPLRRLGGTDVDEPFARAFPMLGARDYLRSALREGWRLLPDLFDDSGDFGFPANDVCRAFLDAWRRPDPDRGGRLMFDFRQGQEGRPAEVDLDAVGAPEGFDTRFLGDVYEQLDRETVSRYALCQTPSFIAEFILSETLVPAFEERPLAEITLIDPTCGSGHFLLDAFWHFARRYLAGKGDTFPQGVPPDRLDIFKRLVQDHLFGADIVELSCELARFRLLLAGIDFVGRDALEMASPDGHPLTPLQGLHFNIVCCDSLVPYERVVGMARDVALPGSGEEADEAARTASIERVVGTGHEQREAWRVLHRKHTVSVGNPPYVQCDNPRKREFYRSGTVDGARRVPGFSGYASISGQFPLGVPFTERFFEVTMSGGWVGLINSNTFARRPFGARLIERVLPKYELRLIVDCSGVNIPGHGTPTVILIGCKRPACGSFTPVIACTRADSSGDQNAEMSPCWLEIKWVAQRRGRDSVDGLQFVELQEYERSALATHPWIFGNMTAATLDRIQAAAAGTVRQRSLAVGAGTVTGADDLLLQEPSVWRRLRLPTTHLVRVICGDSVRDWAVGAESAMPFPYDDDFGLLPLSELSGLSGILRLWRPVLQARKCFGVEMAVRGIPWYSLRELYPERLWPGVGIAFAFMETHNHFVPFSPPVVYNQSAPVVKLAPNYSIDDSSRMAGILNSSVCCLVLKHSVLNKGYGKKAGGRIVAAPEANFYQFTSTPVANVPLPPRDSRWVARLTTMAVETQRLGESLSSHHPRHLLCGPNSPFHGWSERVRGYRPPSDDLFDWTAKTALESARTLALEQCRSIRRRMVWLQEEMDWLAYGAYGLLSDEAAAGGGPDGCAVLTPETLYATTHTPELGPEQRPFQVKDNPDAVAALSAEMQPVWQARLAEIARNEAVALIEDPVYKRRWIEPEWEAEFTQALVEWMLDKVEWLLEHWPGFSVVTGLTPSDVYVPFAEAEIGPAERTRLLNWLAAPVHLTQLAARFSQDPRAMAVMAVYAGSDQFDTQALLAELMEKVSVPASDELLFKESGLLKKRAWGTPWKLTDEEAARQPKPPEFVSGDHRSPHTWSLRGKLNVPRERFIHYLEYERGWYGWAGWDARQRAGALVWLLERAQREGLDQAARLRLMAPLHRILDEGQLVAMDDPQPSVSPLPPCDVSHEEWHDLVHIAGDSSLAGWPLGGESPYDLAGVWDVRTSRRTAPTRRAAEPAAPAADGDATAEIAAIEAAVLEALGERSKLTLPELLGELPQVDEKRLKKALKRLRDAGRIAREGRGKNAGFRLPEPELELDMGE
jgi:hypothetical protein